MKHKDDIDKEGKRRTEEGRPLEEEKLDSLLEEAEGKLEKQPFINLPTIIIVLLAIMAAIHGLRSFLTLKQDDWLIIFGAFIPARFIGEDLSQVPGGQWAQIYSWVSYNFLHGDSQHLLLNSIWFVVFGAPVAKRLSTFSFIAFFIFTSFVGALVYLLMHWGQAIPVIGASAVVSGLMGALTRFMFSPGEEGKQYSNDWISEIKVMSLVETLLNKNAMFFVVIWVGINYFMGVGNIMGDAQNSIAWEAHLGGFFAGFLCYGLFERRS